MKTPRFLVTLLVAFILSFVQSCTGIKPMSGKSGSGSRTGAQYAQTSAQGQKRGALASIKGFFGFDQKPAPKVVQVSDKDLSTAPSAIRVLPALPYVENDDLSADPLLVGPIDPRFAVVSEDIATASREVRTLGAQSHVITNLPPLNASGDTVSEKTASPTKTAVRPEMGPADITIPKDAEAGLLPTITPPGETAIAAIPEPPKETPKVEEKPAIKVVESTTSVPAVVKAPEPVITTQFVTNEPMVVVTKDPQRPLRAIMDPKGDTVGFIARIRVIASGFPVGDKDGKFQIGNLGIFTGNDAASERLDDISRRTPRRVYLRPVLRGFDAHDVSNRDAECSELASSILSKVENEARLIRPPDIREVRFRTEIQPVLNFTGFKSVTIPAKREAGTGEFVQITEILVQEHTEAMLIHCFDSPIGKDGYPLSEALKPDTVLARITEEMLIKNRPVVFLPSEFAQARQAQAEDKLDSKIGANAAFFSELDFYTPERGSAPIVNEVSEQVAHNPSPSKVASVIPPILFGILTGEQVIFWIVGLFCVFLVSMLTVLYYKGVGTDMVLIRPSNSRHLHDPTQAFWLRARNIPSARVQIEPSSPATEIGATVGLKPPSSPFVAKIGAVLKRKKKTSRLPRCHDFKKRFELD